MATHTRSDSRIAGDAGEKLTLFDELAQPLRTGARKGIRRVTHTRADEADVEEIMVRAFNEYWDKDRAEIRSPAAMATTIALRRGMDQGRRIIRERDKDRLRDAKLEGDVFIEATRGPDNSVEEDAELMVVVLRCRDDLTEEQRDVISATIEGTLDAEPVGLKDFAALRGTTSEACRRMRQRGVDSLKKCVKRAMQLGVSYE